MNLGKTSTRKVEGLSGWCARHDVPYNAAVRARDRGQLAIRRHDERGRTHVQLHGTSIDQLRGHGQRRQHDERVYRPSDRPSAMPADSRTTAEKTSLQARRQPQRTTAERTSLAERARQRREAA